MTFLYILMALVAIVVVLAVMAPREYEVKRTIAISRERSEVYDYLKYQKNMEAWSSWANKDPGMKREYRGQDGELGAVSHWSGNKDVGEGEQEITALEENQRIESRLRFFKPWKSESDAFMNLKDGDNGQTLVEWGFRGQSKLPFSILMLFMSMDSMIGKDFEEGLQALKEQLEAS